MHVGWRRYARSRVPASRQRGTVTGLDLGSAAIHLAVLGAVPHRHSTASGPPGRSAAPAGPEVRRLARVPLPPGAVTSGVVQEPSTVTESLRGLVADAGIRGRRVVLGVQTPHLVVRAWTLPPMPPDQVRRALPYQARNMLPFPVDDAVLDFSPLPVAGSPSPGPLPGLLTAVPRASVIAAVQAVEAAGLTVVRVDPSPFGLLRSTASAGDAVEALVDIGADLTTIVVHRNGLPQVVRVLEFGGRRLTGRLAAALSLPAADAETATRTVGVVGDSLPALQLRDEIRPLLAELRASLRYFVTTVGSTVDRVLLTGGTAALPGITGLLGAQVALPVGRADALRHVRHDSGGPTDRHASAVSVGLALASTASVPAADAAPPTHAWEGTGAAA